MAGVSVDFVARDQPHGGWSLVLVESGPWDPNAIPDQLRRIQDRLYGCLDAALEGRVSGAHPDSRGKPLMIRLDAFDVAVSELREFFNAFSDQVPRLPGYATAISAQEFFPTILFELNVGTVRHGG
jgi:hypothetical protein